MLTLFDPDRSQSVTHLGRISGWDSLTAVLRSAVRDAANVRLRILTETVTAPALAQQAAGGSPPISRGEVAHLRAGRPRQHSRRR